MKELHYEFIEDRPEGHQWRVADDNDDFVDDFADMLKAREYVRRHNRIRKKNRPGTWRY